MAIAWKSFIIKNEKYFFVTYKIRLIILAKYNLQHFCPSLILVGCQINKIPISHGSFHRPRRCVECACDNGRISCTRQDPVHDCPKLNCPLSDQIQEEGECCKICKCKFEMKNSDLITI